MKENKQSVSEKLTEKLTEEFKITFIRWSEPVDEIVCDFCEKNKTLWYCDFLCEGYCEECMNNQKEEYRLIMNSGLNDENS